MAPNSAPRHPRAANQSSRDRGTYSAGSIIPKPKTCPNAIPIAAPSGAVVPPSKTNTPPKKSAKGKEKVVNSDVDPETDEEGRVAPRRRLTTIRQAILENNPNYFKKQHADKAKRDRQYALSAENPSADNDTGSKTTSNPARKSATKKPAAAATKSSKSSTIQNGKITKSTKVKKQPQKAKREHRPSKYGYETVPDDSDDFGAAKNKTIGKLRETIDRHARWCPFVQIKKQQYRTHRRTQRLERLESESEDNNETTEQEEIIDENLEEDDEQEEDQSDAASDDVEDTQPTKKKQSARKPAPSKPALKKGAATKAPSSKATSNKKARFEETDLSKEREGNPDGMEANNDSDESQGSKADESEDEEVAEKAAAATEVDSDEQLSSLNDDKVEELQEAHEHEQNDLNRQATSDEDTSSQKRKRADRDSGQGKKVPTKKQIPSA